MEKIKALLSVKKIIALLVTGTFVFLSITGRITPEQFVPIAVMVIGYYFGQSTVKEAKGGE